MKNWIRKPLLKIGVLQFPFYIFTVMGGGFLGLVSVDVQAYLLFPSSIALASLRLSAENNENSLILDSIYLSNIEWKRMLRLGSVITVDFIVRLLRGNDGTCRHA